MLFIKEGKDTQESSQPSVSIHGSNESSEEVYDHYSSLLELTQTKSEDLTDA